MVKNKIKKTNLLFVLISFLLLVVLISDSSIITTFSDGSTSGNLTFNESVYIIKNSSINKDANITYSKINLSTLKVNISINYTMEYVNMTDGCTGEIGLAPNSTYDLEVCINDGSSDVSGSCKSYTSGIYNKSSILQTKYGVLTYNSSYRLKIHWKRIKYQNVDNSSLNGFLDNGETADSGVRLGVYPSCSQIETTYAKTVFNNQNCDPSSKVVLGGSSIQVMYYRNVSCSDGVGTYYINSGASGRIYEGYNFTGGTNATASTCVRVSSNSDPCIGAHSVYNASCTDGTQPKLPNDLCTYAGDNTAYTSYFVFNSTLIQSASSSSILLTLGNISIEQTNFTIDTNIDNIVDYSNTSIAESRIIDLNKTALQNCVNTCSNKQNNNCICSINFTISKIGGILQYSNINITWNDIKSPTWSNNITNNTLPQINNSIQFNITWNDGVNISTSIFSWNCSSSGWTNLTTKSSVLDNETFIFNQTLNYTQNINSCYWKSYANDTSNNWNQTDNFIININKMKPNLTVSINNKPLDGNEDINVTITFSDPETDTWQRNETIWYNNSVEVTAFSNLTRIGAGNTSDNETWIVSARVYDGFNWSDWVNDSVVIADSTPPTINSLSVSATSVYTTGSVTFSANVTDISSGISSNACKFELYKSDLSPDTFNMTATNLKVGDIVSKEQSMTTINGITIGTGTLQWRKAFCSDDSGNTQTNSSVNINITISTAPGGGGGGGGGGSSTTTITQVLGNTTPILTYGVTEVSLLVLFAPSQSQKLLRVINIGKSDFTDGKISVEGSIIKRYINASVCNLELTKCLTKAINIKQGESKFLVITGNFDESLGKGGEGIIKIDGNIVSELPVVIDRPPLYSKLTMPIMKYAKVSEKIAYLISAVILIGGVGSIMLFIKIFL